MNGEVVVTMEFNKSKLPVIIAGLEKVNGFLIANVKDKETRNEEFDVFYQMMEQFKKLNK